MKHFDLRQSHWTTLTTKKHSSHLWKALREIDKKVNRKKYALKSGFADGGGRSKLELPTV